MATNNTNTVNDAINTNDAPDIGAAHAAEMAPPLFPSNQGNRAGLLGAARTYPVINNIQPYNPNVVPHPTFQQQEAITNAQKYLSNHQLLMKFATENKQVPQPSSAPFNLLNLTAIPVNPCSSLVLGKGGSP